MALGNGKVLSIAGAKKLNKKMRASGFALSHLDISMFALAGVGVHCIYHASSCKNV